jgi:cation:H+ antiporter
VLESLPISIALFLLAILAIAFAGTRMATVADQVAEVTGLGEAFVGALFLGGSTSLSGIVTSLTAAATGHPELAVGNALGGIAAQIVFLGIADVFYRKANLEHAAASVATLMQATLLMTLLAIPLLAMASPQIDIFWIHPASLIIPVAYFFGLRLISEAHEMPMWRPRSTDATWVEEETVATQVEKSDIPVLGLQFVLLAVTVAIAGYIVGQTGISLSARTGVSESLVGGLFTAIVTALPELVTTVAAVRRGALALALGGVLGGSSFDVLVIAFSDFAYREGSIYHDLQQPQIFIVALTIVMLGVLLLGLLRREKYGFANIGLESVLLLGLYLSGFSLLFFSA